VNLFVVQPAQADQIARRLFAKTLVCHVVALKRSRLSATLTV